MPRCDEWNLHDVRGPSAAVPRLEARWAIAAAVADSLGEDGYQVRRPAGVIRLDTAAPPNLTGGVEALAAKLDVDVRNAVTASGEAS